MDELLAIAAVALMAFVSTNMDNLLLMALVLGQTRQRQLSAFIGYLGAIALILVSGLLLGRLAEEIPSDALGYLGLLPLGIGLNRLRIALLSLANGRDILAVTTALLADSAAPFDYVIAGTIMGSALLWFRLALYIGRHALLRCVQPAVNTWLVPLLLICVGLYILGNTATDTVAG